MSSDQPKVPQQAIELFQSGVSVVQIIRNEIPIYNKRGEIAGRRTIAWWKQLYEGGDYLPVEYRPYDQIPSLNTTGDTDVEKLYRFIKDHPRTISEISDHLDMGPTHVSSLIEKMSDQGFNILQEQHTIQSSTRIVTRQPDHKVQTLADMANNGNGLEFSIAVPSDFHVGSKLQQITATRQAIQIAREKYHVDNFLYVGDLFAGTNVYRGQAGELYARTAEEQEEAARRLDVIQPGDHWHILLGNHDYSWVKNASVDLGYRFCRSYRREDGYDVNYLGYSERDLKVTDRVSVRLWHPSGGVPYSHSYRAQKGMETLMKDAYERAMYEAQREAHQKASDFGGDVSSWLLFIGHLHIALFMPGVAFAAAQSGCFEGRTLYLKEKGLYPHIGMFVYDFKVADDGRIHEITPHWIGFSEIIDDYQNYEELMDLRTNKPDEVEVMFSAAGRPAA
jgi:hypothetical protein